jgi:hypothetical protein
MNASVDWHTNRCVVDIPISVEDLGFKPPGADVPSNVLLRQRHLWHD